MLSGGIRVALLTTAAGLAVGMPAVAALNWLESKLDRFIHLTENAVTQTFTYSLAIQSEQQPLFAEGSQKKMVSNSYA
jgi:biopolymer transport protein ExbB